MFNRVTLIGHLGADPEARNLPSGDAVANIRIATTDRYRDKASGEMKESTEWHRVVFFGRLAEIVEQYLLKGARVQVEGKLRTRKWQDSDGTDRYSTEIVASHLLMLDRSRGEGNPPAASDEETDEWARQYDEAASSGERSRSTGRSA